MVDDSRCRGSLQVDVKGVLATVEDSSSNSGGIGQLVMLGQREPLAAIFWMAPDFDAPLEKFREYME
jgi:hypothetical protein